MEIRHFSNEATDVGLYRSSRRSALHDVLFLSSDEIFSGTQRRIYHVDIRFARSRSFLRKTYFFLGNCIVTLADVEKECEFSLIKVGVSVHGAGPAFPRSTGIDAVRLSAGSSKPRPSERRSEYD